MREVGVSMDKNAYNAYYCLQSLTGHRGFMDLNSDTPLAYNYSDTVNFFCKDLEIWLRWYDENKCSINLFNANSILKKDSIDWPVYLEELYSKDLGCTIEQAKDY
ncbi:MAG: hypothetical protein ACKO96_38870 [Flammeovirgaceae bacterium]